MDDGEKVDWDDSEPFTSVRKRGTFGSKTGHGQGKGRGKGKGRAKEKAKVGGRQRNSSAGTDAERVNRREGRRMSLAARFLSSAPDHDDKLVEQVKTRSV